MDLSLDWAGRPARAWRANLGLRADSLDLPSAPSEGQRHYGMDGALRWRWLDSLSGLAEARGAFDTWPAMTALDSFDQEGRLGLAWSPWEDWELQALGLGGQFSQPDYDLDHDSKGWDLRLTGQPGPWRFSGRWTRRYEFFDERTNFNAPAATKDAENRQDREDNVALSMAYGGKAWGLALELQGRRLDSNANVLDFGPWQNSYSDNLALYSPVPPYPCVNCDNTLLDNAESYAAAGPRLDLRIQPAPGWRLEAGAAAQWLAYVNRPAKDFNDQFLPGLPPRQDQSWEGRLAVERSWSPLDQPLTLRLEHWHQESNSNDSQFTYVRDHSRLSLRLDY